jgi:hypothetical protein
MRTRRFRSTYVCHVVPILAGILVVGCAGSTPPAADEAAPTEGIELRVVNSRTQDIFIYVVPVGASEYRLGRVRAAGRENLIIPMRFVELGSFALLAHPDGPGEPLMSREIVVAPTDMIEWRLENNLALSQLRVRRR